MKQFDWKDTAAPVLSLFASAGTLVCCALPVFLSVLGLGAVTAGLVTAFPGLVWLSEHKIYVFTVAGIMLTVSLLAWYERRNAPCPADPASARACMRLRRVTLAVTVFSVVIYLVGFFFAFLIRFTM